MRFTDIIYSLLIWTIFVTGIFYIYDVTTILNWGYNKLIDKFEINILLKPSTKNITSEDYLSSCVSEIKKSCFQYKYLKIYTTVLSKQDIFEMINSNEELRYILNLLTQNPFPDVIKIKFVDFHKEEFLMLTKKLKTMPFVKEIIFDYNLSTYLSRVNVIRKYSLWITRIVFFTLLLILVYVLFQIFSERKIFWIKFLIFVVVYIPLLLGNITILKVIIPKVTFSLWEILCYIVIFISSSLIHSVETLKKGSSSENI